jgi:hypothetical protein
LLTAATLSWARRSSTIAGANLLTTTTLTGPRGSGCAAWS